MLQCTVRLLLRGGGLFPTGGVTARITVYTGFHSSPNLMNETSTQHSRSSFRVAYQRFTRVKMPMQSHEVYSLNPVFTLIPFVHALSV